MKQLFSLLIICTLLFPYVTRLGILIDFKINQEIITDLFCINKEAPKRKCNGTCHLSKKLTEVDQQEDLQLPNKTNKERLEPTSYLLCDIDLPTIAQIVPQQKLILTFSKGINPATYTEEIFHPPRFL